MIFRFLGAFSVVFAINTGIYAQKDCTDGKTYLVAQYKNAYDLCLQRAGLK